MQQNQVKERLNSKFDRLEALLETRERRKPLTDVQKSKREALKALLTEYKGKTANERA